MTHDINLYDPSLRPRRDPLGLVPVLATMTVAAVCVAVAVGWAREKVTLLTPVAQKGAAELQARQAALQSAAGSAAARKPDAGLLNAVAAAQRTLLQRRAALQTLAATRTDHKDGFAARLEALARQSVEGLWLTGLVLREDDVVLKGRALQPQLIPVYVQRLDREPSLQGRAFKALDVVRPLDKAARAGSAVADSDAGPALPRTAWVEFTLSGSGADPADSDGEARP